MLSDTVMLQERSSASVGMPKMHTHMGADQTEPAFQINCRMRLEAHNALQNRPLKTRSGYTSSLKVQDANINMK